MHLHLDPVGGIAGDMFIAALLDAAPDLRAELADVIAALALPDDVRASLVPWNDGVLQGSRFVVEEPEPGGEPEHQAPAHGSAHADAGHTHAGHGHRHVRDILEWLQRAPIDPAVRTRAIDVFGLLAGAEAAVHGTSPDDVTFHEIGSWDSIVDIVSAAHLIERIGATSWSVGPLPTGSGRTRSAHGEIPVPAPATTLLLDGFAVIDDGRPGERVTPTGAAILRHVGAVSGAPRRPLRQGRSGIGFGTKRFEGMSNVLRVRELLELDDLRAEHLRADDQTAGHQHDDVAVLEFEIDDQRAEDLAVALDHLRATSGVLDVVQIPTIGKKGRMTASVRVLAEPGSASTVIDRCLMETTTLGVRQVSAQRTVLRRELIDVDGQRVKIAHRGALVTAKADIDDVAAHTTHAQREAARLAAESAVLPTRSET